MKIAMILAAALTTVQPNPAAQSDTVPFVPLLPGQAARCVNANGCLMFAREALDDLAAKVAEEAFMAGGATCPTRRSPML